MSLDQEMLTEDMMSKPQKMAVKDIFRIRACGLTSDCGFGKTVTALTVVRDAITRVNRPTVIFGNKKAVEGAWTNEFAKWDHTKHLKVNIVHGPMKKRERELADPADVYVCSYNNAQWLVAQKNCPDFAVVIADEASCLKGSKSKWRKALNIAAKNALVRLAMTATPKTRNEDDYWGMCRWLDGGRTLGKTIGEFRDNFMVSISYGPSARGWKMKSGAGDKVRDRIKHLFIEYELEDKANVPHKVITVNGKLSDESWATYSRMAKEGLIAGVEFKGGEPLESLEIKNLLDQLSSGFVYEQTMERISLADLEDAKTAIELLRKSRDRTVRRLFDDRVILMRKTYRAIMKKHGNVPVLICYKFKHELAQLQELFPESIDDTADTFESEFNTGLYPVGLLQYQRSSKSVNLQKQCYVMIQYTQTFNFEDNYQIIRRIARQGQPEPMCFIYKLHIEGTVDDIKTDKFVERTQTHEKFRQMILKEL